MPEISVDAKQIAAILIFMVIILFEVLFPFRQYFRRLHHYGKNVVFSLINTVIAGLSGAAMSIWVFLWINEKQIGLLNQSNLVPMFWIRVKQITAEDAKSLIEEQNALLVDVRKPKDYAESHADGALLADKKKVHEVLQNEDKSRPVICYCYRGGQPGCMQEPDQGRFYPGVKP